MPCGERSQAWCSRAHMRAAAPVHGGPGRGRRGRALEGGGDVAAVAAVVSCVLLTWRQVGFWSSSDSLFRRALAVTRDNYVAENNLANVLMRSGRREEAEQHYLAAIR